MDRKYSKIDRLISSIDEALRITTGEAPAPFRQNPAGDIAPVELDDKDRRHVAGLMRINHTGEICAQALYAGQAATAHDDATRDAMAQLALQRDRRTSTSDSANRSSLTSNCITASDATE